MAPAPTRRLLVVMVATERGGAEDYVLRLAEGLPARGWRLDVVLPPHPAVEGLATDLRRAGARVHPVGLRSGHVAGAAGAAGALARDAVAVAGAVRAVRPHAVLLNLPYPEALPGAMLGCALTGRPAAAVFHLVRPGIVIGGRRRRLYAAVRRRQRWFAVSSAAARGAGAAFGFDARAVPVIPNGIAEPLRPADGARARIRGELGVDGPLVLTIGRLSPQKGHETLLRAVGRLAASHPGARFAWAGDGELAGPLAAAVDAAGLADRITLLGRRADVGDLLAAADIVVLPSRYEASPFFSLLEALAAGVPVVTTTAGAPERMRDGEHGLVAGVDDDAALAAALARLIDDPAEAARIGAGGRALVAEEYTAERMLDRTSALLAELVRAAR